MNNLTRITKDEYYLNIAGEVAKRSTCIRRRYGAVIVKNDEIISTGYNGSPRGIVNCIDSGFCLREKLNIEPGKRYELCKAIHAEQNAIISAKRSDIIGATLYLTGFNVSETGELELIEGVPCLMCKRFIINSGISKVITKNKNYITKRDVLEFIEELNDEYEYTNN